MPQSSNSYTKTLPNGNRVTVKVGSNRSGCYKTVTVRRRNGTSDSRTYRRGVLLVQLLGTYSQSIPRWAREPIVPASSQGPGRSAAPPKDASPQPPQRRRAAVTRNEARTSATPAALPVERAWRDFISKVRASTKEIPSAELPDTRALGWSFAYFASELERGIDIYFGDFTDLLGGGSRTYKLETSDPVRFLDRCLDEFGKSLQALADGLRESTSMTDQPEEIAIRTHRIARLYGQMIQLSLYLKGITSSSQGLADACHELSAWPHPTLKNVRQMVRQISSELPAYVEQLRAGGNPSVPNIRMVAEVDNTAFDKVKSAIEKLTGYDRL